MKYRNTHKQMTSKLNDHAFLKQLQLPCITGLLCAPAHICVGGNYCFREFLIYPNETLHKLWCLQNALAVDLIFPHYSFSGKTSPSAAGGG